VQAQHVSRSWLGSQIALSYLSDKLLP
jgi:hypothetical protein